VLLDSRAVGFEQLRSALLGGVGLDGKSDPAEGATLQRQDRSQLGGEPPVDGPFRGQGGHHLGPLRLLEVVGDGGGEPERIDLGLSFEPPDRDLDVTGGVGAPPFAPEGAGPDQTEPALDLGGQTALLVVCGEGEPGRLDVSGVGGGHQRVEGVVGPARLEQGASELTGWGPGGAQVTRPSPCDRAATSGRDVRGGGRAEPRSGVDEHPLHHQVLDLLHDRGLVGSERRRRLVCPHRATGHDRERHQIRHLRPVRAHASLLEAA
jgi:hypothetical protein